MGCCWLLIGCRKLYSQFSQGGEISKREAVYLSLIEPECSQKLEAPVTGDGNTGLKKVEMTSNVKYN